MILKKKSFYILICTIYLSVFSSCNIKFDNNNSTVNVKNNTKNNLLNYKKFGVKKLTNGNLCLNPYGNQFLLASSYNEYDIEYPTDPWTLDYDQNLVGKKHIINASEGRLNAFTFLYERDENGNVLYNTYPVIYPLISPFGDGNFLKIFIPIIQVLCILKISFFNLIL
ncbi:MAG: hypothetical protein U0457_19220 [Candidatus Sericytochromatia bacterium]